MGIDIDLGRMREGVEFCEATMPEAKRAKLGDLLERPQWAAGFIGQTMKQLQQLAGLVQVESITSPAMSAVLPAFWQAMPTTSPDWVAPPGDAAARQLVHEELGEGVALLKCIAHSSWATGDHYTCPLLDLLPPIERIQIGLAPNRRYIASDATGEDLVRDGGRPSVMCVTDFTDATWYASATAVYFDLLRPKCGKRNDKLIVYIAELLPVVALACQRGGGGVVGRDHRRGHR